MGLIILDRDGVINKDCDKHIRKACDWHPLENSLQAIADLHQAGFIMVVATNQSGIARGYFSEQDLKKIHEKMLQQVEQAGGHISGIYYCPHHPDDNCDCRKPKPGMIYQIEKDFPEFNLHETFVVGDSWRDIDAGKQAGCRTYLVQTGNGPLALSRHQHELGDTQVVDNLYAAAQNILQGNKS